MSLLVILSKIYQETPVELEESEEPESSLDDDSVFKSDSEMPPNLCTSSSALGKISLTICRKSEFTSFFARPIKMGIGLDGSQSR